MGPITIAVVTGLLKDRLAWLSSASSVATAKIAGGLAAITFPTTAEGWGALGASVVTIIYVGSKTFLLWRDARRRRDQPPAVPPRSED